MVGKTKMQPDITPEPSDAAQRIINSVAFYKDV
jgi:hypothetical protein